MPLFFARADSGRSARDAAKTLAFARVLLESLTESLRRPRRRRRSTSYFPLFSALSLSLSLSADENE